MAVLFWIVFSFLYAEAQHPVRLSDDVRVVLLEPYVSILRDPVGSSTFDEIRDPSVTTRFEPNTAERIHYGFTPDVIWIRFAQQSVDDFPRDWFVELGHTRFDEIDWFVVRNGTLAEHHEAGNLRPHDPQAIENRLPVLALTMAAGETAEVYLRLHTRMVVRVPLTIYSPQSYASRPDVNGSVYLFCLGAFLMLFVMGLIFALFTKYRGSLAYSLSIACVILIFLGTSGYWAWLRLPGWRFGVTQGVVFFNELSLVALLLYVRGFFNLPVTMPRINRIIKRLLAVCCALLIWIPFGPYRLLIQLVQLQDLLFGVFAMGIAVVAIRRGDRTARFYLLAWTSFWGLLGVELMQEMKLLPVIVAPEYLVLSGLLLGFILFFVAMADKVNQTRAEHAALQRDMTTRLERQVAERTESLQKAKEVAEAAYEYKGMFLANMSHEIRTPLSALVGLSQAMCKQSEQRKLPADFTRMMEQIRSGGRYLNLMLTNLLDVSAVESGKARVNNEPVALDEWSRSVRDILEPIAATKGVVFIWNDVALTGQIFESDPVRLSQILINLVHNAVKFTPAGHRVEVRFERARGQFAFEVEDEGSGLPAGQQVLFDAFEQSVAVVSGSDQGVGLGLYVVQTNARLLGGQISAWSNPAGGACFRAAWTKIEEGVQKCVR